MSNFVWIYVKKCYSRCRNPSMGSVSNNITRWLQDTMSHQKTDWLSGSQKTSPTGRRHQAGKPPTIY
eukprot:154741-Amphidinium_carterae.1